VELRRQEAERIAREGGDAACELVLGLFDRVGDLSERLEKLERRVEQNSVNSSLPPSSDRGQGPKRPVRRQSGRKQGGQLGHEGASRKLIDDPDETVAVRPDACRKCGHELSDQDRVVGTAARHQVVDLPASAVLTTEHRLLKVACPVCGMHTRAELPEGVEPGAFGPRLRATVVMLAAMLMSRRATVLVLADMFGAKLSTGSVEKILKDASASLAGPWDAIKRAVQAGDVAHADETSWRRAGERMWLWAALSTTAACFVIDETRARSVARDLLGDFDGILVSDRYGVYAMLDPARRQICFAHLARNFIAHADRDGAPGRHGTRIKELIDQVMILDRAARADARQLAWHDGQLRPVHDDLMDALEAGERGRTPELATLCSNVLDLWPALWNFTEHADVEATNNRAERAIRHAVLWRKTSTGTQTPEGDRFVERILSIRATCRCQNRPMHPYLVEVHTARLSGAPIPTPLAAKQDPQLTGT
jgi:transposase